MGLSPAKRNFGDQDGMRVSLTCWSNEGHLSQIFAGLAMLESQGRIRLSQRIIAPPPPYMDSEIPPHLKHVKRWHCAIEAPGRRIYIDVHDNAFWSREALADHEIYLKRSFSADACTDPRVRPLGLNYLVYRKGFDRFEFSRRARLTGRLSAAKYLLKRPLDVNSIESPPVEPKVPMVLFLCRTWAPEPGRTEEKNRERLKINAERAACIRALRGAFGASCIAGFSGSSYAQRHFPDLVVDDPRLTDRRSFLQLVKSSTVCVATRGLHDSNGWKFAEYLANSRPVVTEAPRHEAPGLERGIHYLEFSSAGQCVEAVGTILDSRTAHQQMSQANWEYYRRFVRPDALVGRALGI